MKGSSATTTTTPTTGDGLRDRSAPKDDALIHALHLCVCDSVHTHCILICADAHSGLSRARGAAQSATVGGILQGRKAEKTQEPFVTARTWRI